MHLGGIRSLAPALALLGLACRSAMTVPTPAAPVSAPLVAPPAIVPAPAMLRIDPGAPFAITTATNLVVDGVDPGATSVAEALGRLLRRATGYPLVVTNTGAGSAGAIRLALAPDRASLGDEGYELAVSADSVRLVAYRAAGLFRGVQTLRQLLSFKIESEIVTAQPSWNIPAVTIEDHPRFPWRGAMLDVSRHFFTVKEVEQYIDILALYKMNVLHLGLANDQGWRIAINSRPLLTSVGAVSQVGGGAGGYYSQADYSEIVRYAAERYITIVPEIDLPGHTNAMITAYPEVGCSTRPSGTYTGIDVGWSTLCVDKEESYTLVDDVVREIAALTPGQYFHVGGDEVHSLTPQQYAKFVERVQKIVARHGKTMVGWEEIGMARLAPSSIVQQWKGDSLAAPPQPGVRFVLSPSSRAYLDMKYDESTELGLHWAGYIDLRHAYDWDPATFVRGIPESAILGIEAPLWSETLPNVTAAQYMAMPRLPALAEVGWSAQANRDWMDFRRRLAAQAPRWNQLGINWYRSPQVSW